MASDHDKDRLIRLLGLLAIVGAVVQGLKTISFPNLWAATHLNFDYHFGFLKRSFLGEVLRAIGWDMGIYSNVLWFSAVAMIAALAALVWFARFCGMQRSVTAAFLGVVFWSSYAFGYTVHTIGYLDHVLLLLCVVSLGSVLRAGSWVGMAVACGCGVIGLLVHEIYAAAFVPLVFVCLLMLRRYAHCAVYGGLMVAGVLAVMALGLPEGVTKLEMMRHYQQGMQYPVRQIAFDVFFRDAAANLAEMERRWEYRAHWVHLTLSLLLFLGTALVLLRGALRVGRSGVEGSQRTLVTWGMIGATLAPLLLHLMGWDMHRWNAMTVVNAFVLVCLANRCAGAPPEPADDALWRMLRWGSVVVFLNLAAGFGLLNQMRVTSVPFLHHVSYWLDVFEGAAEFPRAPNR